MGRGCAELARGVILQANEKPRLRQIEKAQERFLHAIQRIIGPYTFPAHHPSEACPVLMHQKCDPAKKAVLVSRLGGGYCYSQGV